MRFSDEAADPPVLQNLRLIAGPILLFTDWFATPHGIVRSPEAQKEVNAATRELVLYQFKTCPFCMKVRRACKRLSLRIETRDVQRDVNARQELLQAAGTVQVPCLKITATDGSGTWMPESDPIVNCLQGRFAG